jgi:hypothetical protein
MFESFADDKRRAWYILPILITSNVLLGWMLLSEANIVFLLPFPYRDRLPNFLLITAFGLAAACVSGTLYLYRRKRHLAISNVLKTPPLLIWCFISFGLAVILGLSIRAFPNQWNTY